MNRMAGATTVTGRASAAGDTGGVGTCGGTSQAVRTGAGLAWYRLRVTIGRRWPGYVALAVLTGPLGGLALAAVTAARRTDSSYPDLLARTNPADLLVQPQVNTYTPGFEGQLAGLPQVRGVTASASFNAVTLSDTGQIKALLETQAQLVASPDGLFTRQDKMIITSGRAADPARPDEIAAFARQLSAVPDPVGPAVSLATAAVAAIAAIILANLVALGPGWRAARTPTAVVLRVE